MSEQGSTPVQNPPQNKRITNYEVFSFALEFGFIIALPLFVFTYLGKYLDHAFSQGWITPVVIILALILSVLLLTKKITGMRDKQR